MQAVAAVCLSTAGAVSDQPSVICEDERRYVGALVDGTVGIRVAGPEDVAAGKAGGDVRAGRRWVWTDVRGWRGTESLLLAPTTPAESRNVRRQHDKTNDE
eukprot:COSAG02_NODE_50_length_44860_cov_203.992739_37_plen_101_part_00